jgi:hypothetical protein
MQPYFDPTRNGTDLKINAILTNSTAQHRQPDQHNNQKYIGTIKKNQP